MNLFSLDKKRLVVKHQLSRIELEVIEEQHGLTKQQVQEQIQRELYQKFMQGIYKFIPTQVIPNADGDEIYTIEGYVISQLTLLELIQEIADMETQMRDKLLVEITKAITYREKNMK